MHINEKSSNKAIQYAAEGRGDGAILISLLILGIICFAISLSIVFRDIGKPVTLDELFRISISLLVLVVGALFFRELGAIGNAIQLDRLYMWKIAILAPHITTKEEKELRAMWALMKNKNDYQQINTKLDSLAQMNGVVLPEPSLKVRI